MYIKKTCESHNDCPLAPNKMRNVAEVSTNDS